MDGLRTTPGRLRDLLAEAAAQGCHGHEADARAMCEVMAHLCTVEPPFHARLVRIALQDNPTRGRHRGRISGGYDLDTPATILLDTFSDLRGRTVAFLEALPPAARLRPAVHADRAHDAARTGGSAVGT